MRPPLEKPQEPRWAAPGWVRRGHWALYVLPSFPTFLPEAWGDSLEGRGQRENRTVCWGQPTTEVGLTSGQLPLGQWGRRGGRVQQTQNRERLEQGGGRREETFRVPWGQLQDSCRF